MIKLTEFFYDGDKEASKIRVQPDPATGYRFTEVKIQYGQEWFPVERSVIYHRIDLSDLREPYLTAVKESLQRDATPKAEG